MIVLRRSTHLTQSGGLSLSLYEDVVVAGSMPTKTSDCTNVSMFVGRVINHLPSSSMSIEIPAIHQMMAFYKEQD